MAIDYMPKLGPDGRMSNIDPEALKQILALRQGGQWTGANTGGYLNGVQQWYDPNVKGNGWRLQYQPGVRMLENSGDSGAEVLDPSLDRRAITKVREDTGGKLGDWWHEDGTYGGMFETQDGGGRQFNTAALMFGGALAGNLAMANTAQGTTAATTAGGTMSAEQAAFLEANMGAGAPMAGMPGASTYNALQPIVGTDLASAAAGGVNTLNGAGTASGGLSTAKTAADTASKASTAANGWEQLAKVGGGLAASAVAGKALSNPADTSRFDTLFNNIIAEQQKASQRGDDLWATYQSTWKPLEQKFAESALNFDTPQRREDYAQRAGLAVADNYAQQRQEAERDMMAAGLDPSTIASLGAASRAWEAKDRAGASNDARMKVEMAGLDLLSGGANFARTMSNAATDQSRVATGNTQAASGILNQQAGLQNQNTANRNALIGDLFGAGLTAWGLYQSSKKTKHVKGKVDGLAAADAVERSPASKWAYKPGQGDGSRAQRMGPMAEDLKREAPGVSDGKTVDAISQLGLHHAAIGNLNKRIRKLEKQADGVYAEA